MANKKFLLLEAVSTLTGTVIGAGILGIPYVVAKAGLWTGIIDIIVIGLLVLMLYLYLGEVVLRTKGIHQLTGYAEIYLGKIGKRLMTFAMVFGNYGALIAYIIGVGSVLAALFGGNSLFYSVVFFAVASLIVYLGLKAVAESEAIVQPIVISLIILVAFLAFAKLNPANITSFDISKIFIPYGVVLFASLGAVAIPEMREELVKNEKILKRSILIGMLTPVVCYVLFALAVVGATGLSTTEVATIGLGEVLGKTTLIIGNLLAAATMASSFLTLGLALKDMYIFDYKIKSKPAWALTCIPPLILVLLGVSSFVNVIGITGILAGGMEGVLIALLALKAKKLGKRKPEYSMPINKIIITAIISLFVIGASYYLWTVL